MREGKRLLLPSLAVGAILIFGACTGAGASPSAAPPSVTPSEAPASVEPSAEASAALACDAVQVGIVTRCENFYTDYWPTIDESLNALYEEAKTTNNGTIVIWDWYELSPEVISAFTTRFPGLTIKTQGFQQNLASAIVTAKETGTENTDYLSGSLTSAAVLYDGGLFAKTDWTAYGVPAEFLTVGPSDLTITLGFGASLFDDRFGLADPEAHYHLPMKCTPWGYSCFRGGA